MLQNWSDTLTEYYQSLDCPKLPNGFECMNPYQSNEVQRVVREYFDRFYADDKPRTLLLGINPGRFGAGITGLSFTDPVILKEQLGIDHSFDMRPELSSRFIHEVIDEYGGLEFFSRQFFITFGVSTWFYKGWKKCELL